jgi:preprotein translocase subunit SecY
MRFFQKIGDIWRHEELRKKLGITLGLILVYRLGSFIVLPGVNSDVLAEQMSQLGSGGLGDILSLFTGGALQGRPSLPWASCLTSRHRSSSSC